MKRKIRDPRYAKQLARRQRVTRSVAGSTRPRLLVFRSAKHIYAQLIDPISGKTLAASSTRTKDLVAGGATGNVEAAKKVGAAIAAVAKEKQIEEVVFHRNGFQYHGRVKALAEAAREAGLRF
ncbi:MAG: 50S ribosomal protein L18 [Deltaproteobacteria bacterium]|nr:50S ribosomal protein L18 [Deltaproteobacteria bacterium]MBW2395588.1 50S ribosomal protein L18 [Deltaproteobacteria bacterium]